LDLLLDSRKLSLAGDVQVKEKTGRCAKAQLARYQ
jgi:hypothetical protein